MAKCGNCGKADVSVAEIRECYGAGVSDLGYASYAKDTKAENAKPTPVEITEGFWKLDGDIYKVQRAVHGSGRLYAKRLFVTGIEVGTSQSASFEYAPGMMPKLRDGAHELTQEEAAEFGKLYGICCICGRTLTNEESIAAGIGPICSGKQGW